MLSEVKNAVELVDLVNLLVEIPTDRILLLLVMIALGLVVYVLYVHLDVVRSLSKRNDR